MIDFNFKKKFGQNFIRDKNIISKIVSLSDIDANTLVIEIGPGSGALTSELVKVAKNVVAYEIDESLKVFLDELDYSNLEIKYVDILKSNIGEDIDKYDYERLVVVANLPYYITAAILTFLLGLPFDIDSISVMVQKEVANRIVSSPGSRDYGSLSVFINYYYNSKKLMDVSREVFYPKPNVVSSVVRLDLKMDRRIAKDENLFFKLVRESFQFKRKTIKNNLGNYDLNIIEKVLNKYGLDLSVRAEMLNVEIFLEMADELYVK